MKHLLTTSLLFYILLLLISCYEKNRVFYHEYEPTASDFAIRKWNIPKENLPKHYVKETVDDKGRVIELKFFKNDSISYDNVCGLNPWVKYDYPNDTTIVEHDLNSAGKAESDLECGMPSKIIYQISKDHKLILKSLTEYSIDTDFYLKNGWTVEEVEKVSEEIRENNKRTIPTIGYFSKSSAKLAGKFPISSEFNIGEIYYNPIEQATIKKALK